MDLSTGRKMDRAGRIKVLPITQQVIDRVEQLAAKQGVKGFTIQNRDRKVFYPTDWLAGVDYDPENDDSDDEDENYKQEIDDASQNDDDSNVPGDLEDIDEDEIEGLAQDMD